jgi:serine protease inhibitor
MSSQSQSRLVAASINDVAFDLYRKLSASANLVFSPLSIYCVVRMLYAGARGETCRALSELLRQESHGTALSDGR